MSSHALGIMAPGASRKRKEREASDGAKSQKPLARQTAVNGSTTAKPLSSSSRLLAGYMAYEFLTKGTLLGQKFDPEPMPMNHKKVESRSQPSAKLEPATYAEVAKLMMTDGAHIPGVVNPTQLARWIQM